MATTGAGLQPIYERLNAAPAYHPLEADTFADWSLEAGDIVTVSRDGTDYASPVHQATHVWKGQSSARISSGGDERREAVARVSRKKYNSGGSGVRSGEYVKLAIADAYNGLGMFIIQTASVWQTNLVDAYNGLSSSVTQTASMWQANLNDAYNGLSSTVTQTASKWEANLNDAYNGLSSTVTQTASKWQASLNDAYNGLSSTVTQTASKWEASLNDAYNGLSSTVTQTASKWEASLNDAYNGLSSTVTQTASKWEASLADAYNGLSSTVTQTASEWQASLSDAYNGLSSTVTQTASSWNSKITSNYNKLVSLVEQTASSWSASVSGVVDEDGNVTAASIAIAINKNGSTAKIAADHIELDGSTTLNDVMTVLDNSVHINKTTYVGGTLYVTGGNGITIQTGGTPATNYNLTPTVMANMIVDAQVDTSTNTLKLWKITDEYESPSITFSKAISSASWGWANGAPRVTLSPQSQSFTGPTISHSSAYLDNNDRWVMDVTWIDTSTTPPTYPATGHVIGLYNYLDGRYDGSTASKKITSNGTYTPGSAGAIDFVGFSKVVVDVDASVTGEWEQSNPQSSSNPYNKYTVRNANSAVVLAETVTTFMSYNSTTHKYSVAVNATSKNEIYSDEMADTDGYNRGWDDATSSSNLDIPTSGSGGTLTVKYPLQNPSRGSSTTRTYTFSNNGNNSVDLKTPVTEGGQTTDVTVATFAHNKWNAGWDDATSSTNLTIPTASGSSESITVKYPLQNPSRGSNSSRTYTLANNGNNAVDLKTSVTSGGQTSDVTVATITHGKWNAGWDSATSTTNLSVPVGSSTSTAYITVKYPDSSSRGSNKSQTYTMSNNNDNSVNLTTTVGSQTITVARFTHNKWNAGWDSATSTTNLSIPVGSSTNSYITVKYPLSTTRGSNSSRTYTLANDGDDAVKLYTSVSSQNITVAKITHNKYTSGWTGCYNTVGISPSTAQTLGYGGSVTVYAQAKSSSGASSKTNVASVKITAPADRYGTGWSDARTSVGDFPASTPASIPSSITVKKPSSTAGGTAASYTYALSVDNNYAYLKYSNNVVARTSNTGVYNAGATYGWNYYWGMKWYLPTENPPSGFTERAFYVPTSINSWSDPTTYAKWTAATNAWNTWVPKKNYNFKCTSATTSGGLTTYLFKYETTNANLFVYNQTYSIWLY